MNEGGASTTFNDVTATGTLSGLTFTTASNLTTGQTYRFKIIANNAVGQSPESPQSLALMAAILPTAPQSLSKVAATYNSITVAWTAPSDDGGTTITGFKVFYNGGGSSTTYSEVATVSGSAYEYVHTSLSPPGESFSYKVSALNYIGEGPQSSSIMIVASAPPDAPAAPTRTGSTLTSISI